MTQIGIEPVPLGETANFDGLSELQVAILAVYIVTSALATVGLVMRFYTGIFIVRNLGADAFLLLASWVVYLASFVGMIRVFPCGFGKHLWSITEENMKCYMDSLLFLGITYFWPTTLAKLSLIALYHRIDVRMGFRMALYAVACTVVAYTLAFTIILSGPCNPLSVRNNACLNKVALSQAVLNITTDGVLVILPTFTLWNLQITRRQKITVACILGMGSGAMIASCVRIAYVQAMLDSPDVLYTQGSAAVWSAVEVNIGILCNCLATMKPFVRRHMPWLVSLIGVVSGGSSNGGGGKTRDSDVRFGNGRGSRASYQLHSMGRDQHGLGDGEGGGGGSGGGSVLGEDGWMHKGRILVTTSTSTHVPMGGVSDSHASTDEILRGSDVESPVGQLDSAGKMV